MSTDELPGGMTLERLQDLVNLLTDTSVRWAALADRRETLAGELQRAVDAACSASSSTEMPHVQTHSLVSCLEELETSTKAVGDALQHDFAGAEGALEALRGASREHGAVLQAAATEAAGALEKLSESAVVLHAAQEGHGADAESAFEAFSRSLQEHQHDLLDAFHTASTGIHEGTQQVREHTHETQAAMSALGDSVNKAIHDAVHHAFSEAGQKAKEAFHGYVHGAESHAHAWTEVVTNALADAATHAAEQVAGEVANGVAHVLERGIELLADEVVHQTGLMTVGASVTAALTPILPEIVVAKGLLHFLNKFF